MARVAAQYAYMVSSDFESPEARYALGPYTPVDPPMQLFNVDETGISIVHKPGKVVTELGRRNVWGITSAEGENTYRSYVCVCIWVFYSANAHLSEKTNDRKVEGGCSPWNIDRLQRQWMD